MQDTAHLSLAEHGAYTMLLDHYYGSEKPLPNDNTALFRICRAFTQDEQTAVMNVADSFFPVNGDGLRHNKRADKELAKRQAISQKRAKAGAKGADSKWHGKDMTNDTTPTTTTTETATPTTTTPKSPQGGSERFDEFWEVYPKKRAKKDALAKWKRKGLDKIADQLIADVKNRIENDDEWRGGFIPHPTTYINGERWNDEISKRRQQPSPSPSGNLFLDA